MGKALFYLNYKCQLGELILGEFEGKLCLCDWHYRKARKEIDARLQLHFSSNWQEKETEVLIETRKQVEEFLCGNRQKFELPLILAGSDFQKRVWNELLNIPYGKTVSYLDLAKKLQNPGAVRAVAAANGANSLSIIVPCHRVVGENGQLTGYAGGLPAKRKLLDLEGRIRPKSQLNLFEF